MEIADFERQLSTASDRRLLDMIDHPEENQPDAVEAARSILNGRKLSPEDLAGLKAEQAAIAAERSKRREKIDRIATSMNNAIDTTRALVIDSGEINGEKRQLVLLLIALVIPFLILMPRLLELGYYLEYPGYLDGSTVGHFLPLVWLPVSIYHLWKKRSIGWFGGIIFSVHHFSIALILWINAILDKIGPDPVMTEYEEGFILHDESWKELFLPEVDPFTPLLTVLLTGAMVYLFMMNRSTIIYGISNKTKWATASCAMILTTLIWIQI